ncbi:MAG: metal-sensing transcriptional repressor [Candidatus Peregrinibacteria bacterium]|nr:metal-sensing transcriptional repressor [Candidatus Peregrinibacteria bacterium]MDZ4244621.1 metal-sensing transcriptional repressor [Candidatus Gracilibacteria bacterium]
MEHSLQEKSLKQLKKGAGMLQKVIKMIENGDYCMDILQQSLATIGFIKSANQTLLENHLNTCFKKGMASSDNKKQEQLIKEILRIVDKT